LFCERAGSRQPSALTLRKRWSESLISGPVLLVVSGEDGSNGAPVPTIEILPPTGLVVTMNWLERTDPDTLYPFIAVLPSGGIFARFSTRLGA